MSGKGMSKTVAGRQFAYPRSSDRFFERTLRHAFGNVVSLSLPAPWIHGHA
jgi:hypothetical protein